MEESSKKNRQVAKISVFITSIFIIFISISYALINQTLFGTKRQVITTGNLELKLTEGNAITLENALPMYDEVGMIQDPFEFELTNKTDNDTNYTLKLVDVTPNNVQKLDTAIVKYGLEKDGEKTIKLLSDLTEEILDEGKIRGNQTIFYTLRLWIDSSVENENLIKNKNLSYRIDVVAGQIKKVAYKGMIRKPRLAYDDKGNQICAETGSKDYCEWTTQINSVVLENQINIPEGVEENKRWDLSVLNDGSVMGYLEEYGTSSSGVGYKLHIQGNGKIYANVDSSFMFGGFQFSDAGITGLEYLDTSQVENMSGMFVGYSSSQPLDLSYFDTSNVTDMTGMFSSYSSSQSLDLSHFDTSNVTNMSGMFGGYSSSQPLDLSNLDTANVTDMSTMFFNYSGGLLTLGNWETGANAIMSYMFYEYSGGQPLDLSYFDTSKVTNMSYMFYKYSSSQPLNLSTFDTSNVTNMSGMFMGYHSNQVLNLSTFDTSNVTDMGFMFFSYSSNQPLDLSNFDTSNVTGMSDMFWGYSSNASLDLSSFDFSKVTSDMGIFSRDSQYYSSPILVKDEAMKAWVLARNSNLTNVTVKSA